MKVAHENGGRCCCERNDDRSEGEEAESVVDLGAEQALHQVGDLDEAGA